MMDRNGVFANEHGQHPTILIEQTWSIKELLYGKRTLFSCRTHRVFRAGKNSAILPARVAMQSQRRIRFNLPVHGASRVLNRHIAP